ncbi:MAG: type II toxin-antitoxin system HicA family toxin [Gaiella sp.]
MRALRAAGFEQISQRGSHLKLRNLEGRTAIVPMHRELAPGTLRSHPPPSRIDRRRVQQPALIDEASPIGWFELGERVRLEVDLTRQLANPPLPLVRVLEMRQRPRTA